jgi:hypothetical protein
MRCGAGIFTSLVKKIRDYRYPGPRLGGAGMTRTPVQLARPRRDMVAVIIMGKFDQFKFEDTVN